MTRASMRQVLLLLVGCPLVAALVQVDGSGSTNPSKFFWKVMEMIQVRAASDVRLTYRTVGSAGGQREFSQKSGGDLQELVPDFGAGDMPMPRALHRGITDEGRQMVHVPFALGAVAVFHSVPADMVGAQGLRLSPCVLAKIFSGKITTWDHADIRADNAGLSVPAGTQIKVGRHKAGSSATSGLAAYLTARCPANWTQADGAAMGGGDALAGWPAAFAAVRGSEGTVDHISGTPFAIGYAAAGHGQGRAAPGRQLSEARLMSEGGTWLASPCDYGNSANSVAAAAEAVSVPSATADWSSVNLISQPGSNTWPIILISYLYLPQRLDTAQLAGKASLVKAFVDTVMSAEGQGMLAGFSFFAVPAAWNTWSSVWASSITKPKILTPEYTTSSTAVWSGMDADAVSSTRNATYSLRRLNVDPAVQALQDRIDALETTLDDYGITPLHGSGTTNPKSWFAKAMKLMETRTRVPLHLSYRAVGSSTGQKEFVGDTASSMKSYNHFGAGDIPMSKSRFDTLQANNQKMVHIPFALGAIGIFHSVPAEDIGGGSLQLDTCLLAKIFMGQITTWDHADIKAQNSGFNPPAGQAIEVAHRTLGSSSTGGFSGYLNKKCPSVWTKGASSTIAWPAQDNVNAVQGSQGMQAFIDSTPYAIGYLDAGHGHDFNMAEVALTNKDGQTRTSKQSIALGGVADAGAAGVTNSAFPSDPTSDWSSVNLYDMAGSKTWPIVLVSYMYVKKDQSATNPKTAAALEAFIKVVLEDNDGLCEEFGFTKPSTTLKQLATSAAASIQYPAGIKSFVFETQTDVIGGMAANVISKKRNSYEFYEDAKINDALSEVQEHIRVLRNSGEKSVASSSSPLNDDDDAVPIALSIVALVIALCAGVPGCMAFMAMKKSSSERAGSLNALPSAVVGSPHGTGSHE